MRMSEVIPEINRKTERDANFGEHQPKLKKKKTKKQDNNDLDFESPLPKVIRPATREGY